MAERLFSGLKALTVKYKVPCTINHTGALGCLFFTNSPVTDYKSAKQSDTSAYASFFKNMLSSGIYLAPAQFEAIFLSAVHTNEHIKATLQAAEVFFKSKIN